MLNNNIFVNSKISKTIKIFLKNIQISHVAKDREIPVEVIL
jgi:hypothetical protein